MDFIDFIDSRTLREYYRTTPLPPAMMCILIAQSHRRTLADKLAALREIRDATSPEDFADGEYQLACNDLDFAAVPKRWSSGIDFCDQHFSTLVFRPDRTHPCGGVFHIDDVMPAGSDFALERVDPEELPEEYGVLLSVAEVVAGRTCICQLLEAYSQGALDSLLKFTREQRAERKIGKGNE